MHINNKFDHIEDVLINLYSGQWFGWSDSSNKVYQNLIIHDKSKDKPTKKFLEDKLKKQQSDYDFKQYQGDRIQEYPSIQELIVALYDEEDKQSVIERRAEVKSKFPKPD
tara:strand:- start:422 stop:751 length:330 start_codon:yes stop_codon:yes gene_type:complete